ncbi:DNA translocase FtsK [Ancylobacter sp. G4_0304]|uniref:DNA translocase FtsK n=1 Tax=Ancylobacter sp. G4_0304 TaxID=3114289 RepID=UPI0039C6E4DB
MQPSLPQAPFLPPLPATPGSAAARTGSSDQWSSGPQTRRTSPVKATAGAATGDEWVPSWLQPFTMPSNTRFTRTPDYLLRQPPAAEPAPVVEPGVPEAPAVIEAAAVTPPRPSQTPVLRVPPRKPPLGPATLPLRVASAGQLAAASAAMEPATVAQEVAPAAAMLDVAAPPAAPEPAVLADFGPAVVAQEPPSSIQRIAGLIQLGWDTPPMPAPHQDHSPALELPWSPDAEEEDEDAAAFAAGDVAEADEAAFAENEDEDALFDQSFTPEALLHEAASLHAETEPDAAPEPAEAPAASFGSYAVASAEVSFSWPVFTVTAAAARAPEPVVAPPAAIAPQATAPVMAPVAAAMVEPPRPAPVAVTARLGTYELPPLELLAEPPGSEPDYELSEEFLDRNSVKLQQVLHDFGVRGEIIDANPGPVVTLYELEPAPGIKSSRVIGLSADIARSMSAISARVAVVEGRNVIGIELPNQRRETVWLREMLASHEFDSAKAKLGIALGKTIGGEPVIADLARMPHLLVAGTTGSGKSVAINTMILSLLYRHRPDQCRLIMIDPKMLELSVYEGIPHLLTPVVTDPKKAIVALKWAVREMEDRYKKMSRLGVRNIDGFNARVAEAAAKGEIITRTVQSGFDRETGQITEEEEIMDLSPLPYIVIVVDEMADLMMVAGKDIEGAIQRLAQMARAAGIHLIMATQRPSVDVITGTIKANFPTRISFQVTSKIDSRTILGEMGAEQLLGQGDMLYMAGGGRISRVHGPFVSDQEVERVVDYLKAQGRPEYLEAVTAEEDEELPTEDEAVFDKSAMGEEGGGDVYDQAVAVVMRDRKASTSYIQRRLQIGYNRAASIMERMENEGLVGPANHAGKREILMDQRAGR